MSNGFSGFGYAAAPAKAKARSAVNRAPAGWAAKGSVRVSAAIDPVKRLRLVKLARRIKPATPAADFSGGLDTSAFQVDAAGVLEGLGIVGSDWPTLSPADVTRALYQDMEGLAALACELGQLTPEEVVALGEPGRSMLVSVGQGIADPWMRGLAGLHGQQLGKSFFSKIGDFAKGLVKNVGQVVGAVAPIAAPILAAGVGIPVAAAIGAGANIVANSAQGMPAVPTNGLPDWLNQIIDVVTKVGAQGAPAPAQLPLPKQTLQEPAQSVAPAAPAAPNWLPIAALAAGAFLLTRR